MFALGRNRQSLNWSPFMTWSESITNRLAVWKAILWRRLVVVVTLVWLLFSNFTVIRDNFLPPGKIRNALETLNFLSEVPLWGWALGLLVFLFIIAMEGAYREISHRDEIIEQSKPKRATFAALIQLHASEQYHARHAARTGR